MNSISEIVAVTSMKNILLIIIKIDEGVWEAEMLP
jgi:hypothetical protein